MQWKNGSFYKNQSMQKSQFFWIVMLAFVAGAFSQILSTPTLQTQINIYSNWEQNYKVSFASNEVAYRALVLDDNIRVIEKHNANPKRTYNMGVNKFAAYTNDEFAAIYLGTRPDPKGRNSVAIQGINGDLDKTNGKSGGNLQAGRIQVSDQISWDNIMTPVKDQGKCGSCWAFSTIALVESLYVKTNSLTLSLSEQEVADCSYEDSYNGCNGGWPSNALNYILQNEVSLTSAYPYTASDESCNLSKKTSGDNYALGTAHYYYNRGNCQRTKFYLESSPLIVAVDSSGWSLYENGVYECTSSSINHGVLLVGYNADGNWRIKNSWGTSWGENGYINLPSGNSCAVCNYIWTAQL